MATSDFHESSFISRDEWGAKPPKQPFSVIQPVPHVFIHHSAGPECSTLQECSEIVRGIQRFHQQVRGWNDIGYNWLIGGDGNIYEGRNWDKEGAHTYRFNRDSVAICFLGNFTNTAPSPDLLNLSQNLIANGLSLGHIRKDYKVHGHRDAGTTVTECPGDSLYKIIQNWPRYQKGPLMKSNATNTSNVTPK